MEASLSVEIEHLGGTATARIATTIEPNAGAWNVDTYTTMAVGLNGLLHAMLSERDRLRFEEERIGLHTSAAGEPIPEPPDDPRLRNRHGDDAETHRVGFESRPPAEIESRTHDETPVSSG